jgi:hypothetical protein
VHVLLDGRVATPVEGRRRHEVDLEGGIALGGRSGEDLLIAFRAVSGLVMGFAQAELAGPLSFEAGEPAAAVIGRMRALPSERYPRSIAIRRPNFGVVSTFSSRASPGRRHVGAPDARGTSRGDAYWLLKRVPWKVRREDRLADVNL